WTSIGEPGQERQVDALVNYADVAEARPADTGEQLAGRSRHNCGAGEVGNIHAAGEEMDVRMAIPARLVKAAPAREDKIGCLQDGGFALPQVVAGAVEAGQLVHHVVDDEIGG